MAPTAPTKTLSAREKRMARIRGDIHPLAPHKTLRPEAQVDDGFLTNKKDKRTMKHSAFVSKVEKANKKPLKRRRPNKKLVTTMESLADALPELEEGAQTLEQLREGKVRHKSLKSRPGALKRKEKIVRAEMQRFGASMAALASVPAASASATAAGAMAVENPAAEAGAESAASDATASRWAALRKHISSTMEQNPAFSK
ncbi:ribosome biogenesis protein SLX9-domain-containing protein [Colletotrichum navitas]|uniref:Ribosome biogenesis protein SLX9 n=1 Tax=Colletotrichum navitas TaxID=681940 RepID=A0AAD8Q4C2_9PEZI|nr:ribosome biogenesis protein SLX9-domain-containing protein [Colletotrichum navitas]KAK1595627.1 ribosome biogenesis protein SLX9-domain-containing protein [Colletotrichum navitas]